jgi:hypothetical protein
VSSQLKISSRARSRRDHAGDPLDGLVNLFDLGIVLAVAFLLAALSTAKLTAKALNSADAGKPLPADTVVKNSNQEARSIHLRAGQQVVGRGEVIGTVYQLADGRTIIVRTRTIPSTSTAP